MKKKKNLLFIFYSLLLTPYSVFAVEKEGSGDFGTSKTGDGGTGLGTLKGIPGGFDPGSSQSPDQAAGVLTQIFSNVFGVFTIVGGLLFILYFILGGISWLTSSGKPDRVEKAKKQMTDAVIGLIIVVASYGIAFIIGSVLGIEILQPAKHIIEDLGPGAK